MSVQYEFKKLEARFAAFEVGVVLEEVRGGFLLFKASDGEQLGYDLDEPWGTDDVIDYCGKLKEALQIGVFTTGTLH